MLNFFRKKNKDPKSELLRLIGNYELPSFSATIIHVLTSLRDPDFSVSEIAKQLEGDPGLHVKVLKTVNSAAFGLSTRISNLHHAIALLGRSRLETIVLPQAVKNVLPAIELPFFDIGQFWLSAAKRASLGRALAYHLHPNTQVESFTAGLLQDMALPVLITINPQKYNIILERWYNEKEYNLNVLENESFGYNHSMIGALMAEDWGFPEYLITAIAGHHEEDGEKQVDPAVRLVSYIKGNDNDDAIDIIMKICIEKFGMKQDIIFELINLAFEDAKELSQMLR